MYVCMYVTFFETQCRRLTMASSPFSRTRTHPLWADWSKCLLVGWGRRLNQLCNFLVNRFEGYGAKRLGKMAFPIDFVHRPYKSVSTCCTMMGRENTWTTDSPGSGWGGGVRVHVVLQLNLAVSCSRWWEPPKVRVTLPHQVRFFCTAQNVIMAWWCVLVPIKPKWQTQVFIE